MSLTLEKPMQNDEIVLWQVYLDTYDTLRKNGEDVNSLACQDALRDMLGMSYFEAHMLKLEAQMIEPEQELGEDLEVIVDYKPYTIQQIANILAADPPNPLN